MKLSNSKHLLDVQQNVISLIALGSPSDACLERIAIDIERLTPDEAVYCSIHRVVDGKLRYAAAPNIGDSYCSAIEGLVIGEHVGSCGSSAFRKEPVIVADIANDPLWVGFRELALSHGLRACWSFPILSSYDSVLGVFGVYFGETKAADPEVIELIQRFCALASLVLERELNEGKAKELNKALKYNSHRFESFAQAMPDLVLVLDQRGSYVDIYGSELSSLMLPPNLLKGRNLMDVLAPAKASAMMSVIDQCLREQKRVVFEYELDVQTGVRVFEARVSPIKNYNLEEPGLDHVIWVAQDVTDRKSADDTIRRLSFYDAVTSLPNRRLVKERIVSQLHKALDRSLYGALFYIDLNDFKRVNDAVGASGGDALVAEVAKRINRVLDVRDTLARVGGDDFVVLLDQMGSNLEEFSSDITDVSARIMSVFDERFKVSGSWFRVKARTGISLFGSEQISGEKLINQAESAMYRARETGERVLFFDESVQRRLSEKLSLEHDLEHALINGEITAYYQPQVGSSGEVRGLEALMRWEHPEAGFVSPLKFVPLAEQLGIISELQEVVLRHVCGLIKVIETQDLVAPNFRVAVNISACQFNKDDFETSLLDILKSFDVSPSRITLEITEGMLLEDIDRAIKQMQQLRELGFELSIDDFGTGYSSLSYLQQLPADEIKIDKSFIDEIEHSEAGRNIVSAIIYLARQIDCRIVAEGVEEHAQLVDLSNQNVDLIQGYYIARPMSLEGVLVWLNERKSSHALPSAKSA